MREKLSHAPSISLRSRTRTEAVHVRTQITLHVVQADRDGHYGFHDERQLRVLLVALGELLIA